LDFPVPAALFARAAPFASLGTTDHGSRMSEHIVPVRIYITIFLVLLAGTALTVWAAFIDFPYGLNTLIAMTIAVTKATFVVLYFMHVRYSARLVWVILGSALFWMAILFAFTLADYFTRDEMSIGF
jgi:cytochrome c oxidase subunit 4